jgi:hypothetical protein
VGGFSRSLKACKSTSHPSSKRNSRNLPLSREGRDPGEMVQEIVARYFDEESRFMEAVNRGEEALQRGEYLTHAQVGRRLERFLRP